MINTKKHSVQFVEMVGFQLIRLCYKKFNKISTVQDINMKLIQKLFYRMIIRFCNLRMQPDLYGNGKIFGRTSSFVDTRYNQQGRKLFKITSVHHRAAVTLRTHLRLLLLFRCRLHLISRLNSQPTTKSLTDPIYPLASDPLLARQLLAPLMSAFI